MVCISVEAPSVYGLCVGVYVSLSKPCVCVSCSLMSFVMHVLSLSVLSVLGLCSVWVMSGVLSMNVSRVWCVSVRCRVCMPCVNGVCA
ncbi:unnamed protein product [Camellia sinensis]